jgi:hypothetical protein
MSGSSNEAACRVPQVPHTSRPARRTHCEPPAGGCSMQWRPVPSGPSHLGTGKTINPVRASRERLLHAMAPGAIGSLTLGDRGDDKPSASLPRASAPRSGLPHAVVCPTQWSAPPQVAVPEGQDDNSPGSARSGAKDATRGKQPEMKLASWRDAVNSPCAFSSARVGSAYLRPVPCPR